MRFVVIKNFKSLNRRFLAGDAIEPADVIGAVSFDQWRERGFISEALREAANEPDHAAAAADE